MNKELAWKQFEKTGRIEDYLTYKLNSQLSYDNFTDNKNNICSGMNYENMREWNNHSRN